MTSLLTNPLVYAAAILSVALASHQAGVISAHPDSPSSRAVEQHVPAVQTVNRAAKGDKWSSAPRREPRETPAPDAKQRVIIAASTR